MRSFFEKIWAVVERGQVLVVILAFAVMVYSTYILMSSIVRADTRREAEQSLSITQAEIETDLTTQKTVLEVFSQILGGMVQRGESLTRLQESINDLNRFIQIYDSNIPDYRGIFGYFETIPTGAVYMDSTQRVLSKDFVPTDNEWYKDAVAASGVIIQTSPYFDPSTGSCLLTYACAIYDTNDQRLGVIGINVLLDQTREYVIDTGLENGGYGFLLDSQLQVISHPFVYGVGYKLINTDAGLAALSDDLLANKRITEQKIRDYRNNDVIVFVRQLESGWFLGITVPFFTYYQNVNKMLFRLILLGLILGAALSAMLLYISFKKKLSDTKNQQKSNFLATVSHEIRTPLNVILGITEIQLQGETLSVDERESFAKIQNSGDLLLGIINDILDLSRIEAGKMEMVPVKYEVTSMINDVIQLNKLRFDNKPIEFKPLVDEKIPSVLIGDELRIKQILNNLLSNAYKYTERGEVIFSSAVEYPKGAVASHVMLVFRVSDTGQGMSPEQLKNLFDEYSRFNLEANRLTEGTGLGMSITRKLLNLMGGKISVESTVGKGTTVTVHIPQRNTGIGVSGMLGREMADNLQQFRIDSAAHIKMAQINRDPMSYGSVLIVDDVESNLFVAKGLMAPYGLAIDTAISGFQAIEKIKSGKRYDIIFMDHMMPKMDGIEATRIIRGLGYSNPIVALTANALTGQADIFLANGFDGFISKPIDIRQLNDSLNKMIRDKQPHHVIEAERKKQEILEIEAEKKKKEIVEKDSGKAQNVSVDPELLKLFVQDADRVISALEAIYQNEFRRNDDVQMYIISVHGIKSALANIGEKELSAFALKLEQAGKQSNIDMIKGETPAFLEALRALVT
ncbi:MAG: ATP-binding protein, partial [Treponema sp.]|nr:ATP-binding protein [Treponema sp.]